MSTEFFFLAFTWPQIEHALTRIIGKPVAYYQSVIALSLPLPPNPRSIRSVFHYFSVALKVDPCKSYIVSY